MVKDFSVLLLWPYIALFRLSVWHIGTVPKPKYSVWSISVLYRYANTGTLISLRIICTCSSVAPSPFSELFQVRPTQPFFRIIPG